MKILSFLSIVFLLFSFTVASAQIDLGFKGGANFASVSDAANQGTKTGFVFGVFGGTKLGDKFAWQAELLYSQQGSKLNLFNFDTDYLNIPIIFKQYPLLGFNIQFGPQFGFIVNDNSSSISETIQSDFEYKNFDVAGVIGIGYDVFIGLRFDARYQFGFINVTDNSNYAGKNKVFTLSVGYSFL